MQSATTLCRRHGIPHRGCSARPYRVVCVEAAAAVHPREIEWGPHEQGWVIEAGSWKRRLDVRGGGREPSWRRKNRGAKVVGSTHHARREERWWGREHGWRRWWNVYLITRWKHWSRMVKHTIRESVVETGVQERIKTAFKSKMIHWKAPIATPNSIQIALAKPKSTLERRLASNVPIQFIPSQPTIRRANAIRVDVDRNVLALVSSLIGCGSLLFSIVCECGLDAADSRVDFCFRN